MAVATDVASCADYYPSAARQASPEVAQRSLPAAVLHRVDSATALAFVDSLFGGPDEWKSPLIRYRLSSDFQADWKEEIGHWLKTAERHAFLRPLLERLLKRTKRGTRSVEVDANDRRHNELIQELAPAMVAHYLDGTGWSFARWEPVTGGAVDVDLQFTAPSGAEAFLQVKAPDQPGRLVGHRLLDGEYAERIVEALRNAADQLPRTGREVKLIVVCANRTWPLSANIGCVVSEVMGQTEQKGKSVTLPTSCRGKFWTSWKHVSGVVVLDLVRPATGDPRYAGVVLLNPVANVEASPDWFPYARVCSLTGSVFHWIGGEPPGPHGLPDGTSVT